MDNRGGKREGAGRPKGSFNESNKQIRTFLQSLLTDGQEKFKIELMSLKGKAFIDAWTTLIEFSTPKLQRTEVVGDEEKPLQIDITKLDEGTIKGLIRGLNDSDTSE